MKKVLFTIIAGLVITVANAQNAKNFAGFSASIGVGFHNVDAKVGSDNGTNSYWTGDGSYAEGTFSRPSNGSTVPSIELSYAKAFSKNWLATVGVNYSAAAINAGDYGYEGGFYSGYAANQTISNNVSVYVAPTYALSSTFAVSAKASYNFAEGTFKEFYYTDDTQSMKGFGYGLGAKLLVNKNVFVQANIDQVRFDEITYTENYDDFYEQNIKNTLTTFSLSIGYKF